MRDYDYSAFAEYYDIFEANEDIIALNPVLHKKFQKNHVKRILDLSCGTGMQAHFLYEKGYRVIASDINREMIKVAKKKYPGIHFHLDDMRTAQFGKFDAVITIYNSIGHLTKSDFEKAVRNIGSNLRKGGLYIFDIFSLDFMRKKFIRYEFIDTAMEKDGVKFVRFNDNTLDIARGIMHVNQQIYIQKGFGRPRILKEKWDMQIYSAAEVKRILSRNGFEVVSIENMQGKAISPTKTLSILVTARKV